MGNLNETEKLKMMKLMGVKEVNYAYSTKDPTIRVG